MNANKLNIAENIANKLSGSNVVYKRIKSDKGLLERNTMNDEKVILTEDNRQVIFG